MHTRKAALLPPAYVSTYFRELGRAASRTETRRICARLSRALTQQAVLHAGGNVAGRAAGRGLRPGDARVARPGDPVGPRISSGHFVRAFRPGSLVHYRYGAFQGSAV